LILRLNGWRKKWQAEDRHFSRFLQDQNGIESNVGVPGEKILDSGRDITL
jgi:hypothetical protein